MTMRMVEQFAKELPASFAKDVVSYARSVQDVLPQIFKEAGLAYRDDLANQLVFTAGVKKLYALCSSYHWILENSLLALQTEGVSVVRMGTLTISREGGFFLDLQGLLPGLEGILEAHGLYDLMDMHSYPELLQHLYRGH